MISIAERHKYIIDKLNEVGFVRVIDMAEELEVTTVTIRRDFKILEGKKLLYRTHGSASPINPHTADRTLREKEQINTNEKNRIAIEAAKLIDESDSIMINSGSTICTFAEQLSVKEKLTVVTASLKASIIMGASKNINVIQLGGNYRENSMSVIGNYTAKLIENIACSKLFLGVDGIDLDFGVTTSNLEEAELNQAMMKSSLKTIILCDSSKFGKKGFGKICTLDLIDTIITDDRISKAMAEEIENLGVELIVV